MLKKLLVAIVLLLQIGFLFAQNSSKPPANPFSFQSGQQISRENVVINNPLILAANSTSNIENLIQNKDNSENNLKPIEQSTLNDLGKSVIDTFEEKMNNYGTKLIPHTLKLFYMLILISIVLTVITQLILGNHFKDIITSLLIIFFMAGFFELLIRNWVEWSSWIVNYFVEIGTNVSDVNLQPSEIIKYVMKYINRVYENLSFTSVGQSLMYVLLAIPTFFLIVQMVAVYIYALFEFIIIGKLSVIYLAFAGIKYTEGYAKKPLMYCLACGLKLMFLQLFFGGALSIISDFSTRQMSIQLAMVMFICSVILNLLVQKLPQLVDTFIHGTTSATMGGSISNMTKALRSVALSTTKAVMAAMDSKKLLESASQLASNRASQNENMSKYVEQSYQKHKQDILNKSDNPNAKNASSSLNSANSGLNASSNNSINTTSNLNNSKAGNLDNNKNQENKSFGAGNNSNSLNHTKENNKSDKNIGLNNQKEQKSSTNSSTDNNSLIHGLKTVGHTANALIRNDFNLNKAQQSLDNQIYKKQNISAEQENLWNRIYSGNSPENYTQAEKYIEHGNRMEKDKKYADDFSEYVQYRKQIFQDSENQLNDFAQDTHSIIDPAQNNTTEIKNKDTNE